MSIRNSLAAFSTALVMLTNAPGVAKAGQAEVINVPSDTRIDFAVHFPQGTLFKFSYNLGLGDHPLNRNGVFFCPQNGSALPKVCFQQFEKGSSSTSSLAGYSDYSSHLEQPAQTPGTKERELGVKFDFEHNKLSLTCPAMPEIDGKGAVEKTVGGIPYSAEEKARLERAILSGQVKVMTLPESEDLIGVFKTPHDENIVVTFPKYNFSVGGIGYYRGNGDMSKYRVTGYDESSGYTMRVEGQGILHIPFDYFNQGMPITLKSENGITTPLQHVDDKHLPSSIQREFGSPRHPANQQPYDTPCATGVGYGS